MKRLGYPEAALLLLLSCSSCVGAKKYKTLATQNEKITTTLLETKEELSAAKRNLHKLEDRSSSNQEELDASIVMLQQTLEQRQAQLQASQAAIQTLNEQSSEQREQFNLQSSRYEAQLKPYLLAKTVLQQEQKDLARLYSALENLLDKDSLLSWSNQLQPAHLLVTLEHAVLFAGSERTISTKGHKNLEAIAILLQQYPNIHLDILGHTAVSSDALGNWKNSTRQPLVVLYALLKMGLEPSRVRLIAQGQYAPLLPGYSQEAAARNARTELLFHYQAKRFLPALVKP